MYSPKDQTKLCTIGYVSLFAWLLQTILDKAKSHCFVYCGDNWRHYNYYYLRLRLLLSECARVKWSLVSYGIILDFRIESTESFHQQCFLMKLNNIDNAILTTFSAANKSLVQDISGIRHKIFPTKKYCVAYNACIGYKNWRYTNKLI